MVIQSAGGGIAASTDDNNTAKLVSGVYIQTMYCTLTESALQGSNIMLAGIVFQLGMFPTHHTTARQSLSLLLLVSLTVFCVLGGEYLFRYSQGRPARPLVLNN